MTLVPGGPMSPPTKRDTTLSFNPGGPMVTALPPSGTAPTPMTVDPGGPMVPASSQSPTPSTKVTSPCSWDGTETLYPYTTTLYRQINCHGCQSVDVHSDIWFCPNMRINDTEKVSTPSTYWSTVCEPLTALSQLTETDTPATITSDGPVVTGMPNPAPTPLITNSNVGVQPTAACPTTFMVNPGQSAGRTLTRYSKFTTTTIQLDCGGCTLVTSTAIAGYGPIGRFTATITLPLGTVTAYACL
ncbi:hypothetical protein QBC46DRAFT_307527 [Diplogelasinospora grovesii]|uniref:Uncharacterized protein n=1 Tax=Diplogelasinospora grovesii TaxID=303347 RepID=A0AAN6S6S1_9PEZI|nr:hypothetical protein QBC46DRAFT_307527 [Diplogelasinospora grovesii]